jgi:hypothetical protein
MSEQATVSTPIAKSIAVHAVFNDRSSLREALVKQALAESWDVATIKSEREKAAYGCRRSETCQWRLNARPVNSKVPDGDWRVTSIIGEHTCAGSAPPARAETSKVENMLPMLQERLETTYKTSTSDIRSTLKLAVGSEVPRHLATRLKRVLVEGTHDSYLESYRLIPAFLACLKEDNPSAKIDVEYHKDGWLERVFICPSQSNTILKYSLRFVALDATFTKNGFNNQHLLIAAGRDGENRTVIYAWALVEGENEDTWKWFCYNLKIAMPDIEKLDARVKNRKSDIIVLDLC